jgi:N-dimethylarginine dimethylaminohydrolase
MSQVITSANQLNFELSSLPDMPFPRQVLMVQPTYFSVDYIINPHMQTQVGKVDQLKAKDQWDRIKELFSQIGIKPLAMEGEENLPDMVFSANQSLPFIDEKDGKHVVMSIMHTSQRKQEVSFIEQWYRQNGYKIHHLKKGINGDFEGCGDAIWHTGKRLLWGGYGFRSSMNALKQISEMFDVPVISLKLVDDRFYHLDTCFCVLDRNTALIYPAAFTDEGLSLIDAVFDRVIQATKLEAVELFACNAVCPDEKNVIIQQGCTDVNKKLRDAGFAVHEVNTSEYSKSGGSVFCMKQMLW